MTPNAFGLVYEDAIGEMADSRYMSEEAFAKASRTADKELFIASGYRPF